MTSRSALTWPGNKGTAGVNAAGADSAAFPPDRSGPMAARCWPARDSSGSAGLTGPQPVRATARIPCLAAAARDSGLRAACPSPAARRSAAPWSAGAPISARQSRAELGVTIGPVLSAHPSEEPVTSRPAGRLSQTDTPALFLSHCALSRAPFAPPAVIQHLRSVMTRKWIHLEPELPSSSATHGASACWTREWPYRERRSLRSRIHRWLRRQWRELRSSRS